MSLTHFEKIQCAARRFLTSEQGASSTQSSLKLDDEELLLELPLLRLGKGGAAVEVGGDSVKSAAGAPGKLPKAPNARAPSNSANTATKRPNPTLQRASPHV